MEKLTTFGLVQPRPSPKMDAIFDALEEGFPGAKRNVEADIYGCWGLIGNNALIMHQHQHVFIDMPYHGRLQGEDYENSYWRFCMNSLHDVRGLTVPNDRFKEWNVDIQENNNTGEYVLICPSSETMTRTLHGWPMQQWCQQAVATVKAQGLVPKVRLKPRKNGTSGPSVADVSLEEDITNASAVITSASLVSVTAQLMGKPVFSTTPMECPTAWCTNTDFGRLNNPVFFSDNHREQLFNNLAYKQFSIKEMRDGTCYEIAREYLGYK